MESNTTKSKKKQAVGCRRCRNWIKPMTEIEVARSVINQLQKQNLMLLNKLQEKIKSADTLEVAVRELSEQLRSPMYRFNTEAVTDAVMSRIRNLVNQAEDRDEC